MTITQLVLYGRLVTFDPARPVIDSGAFHICADERITAVGRAPKPRDPTTRPPRSEDKGS